MTLDRVLSRYGVASRTVAEEIIRAGRVSVEGVRCLDPERWVNPQRQRIALDGRPLRPPRKVYFALNKPKGLLTSHGDPQGRPTIYDLLASPPAGSAAQPPTARPGAAGAAPAPPLTTRQRRRATARTTSAPEWLFPIGRLDQDTSGLLLLTNDSDFAEQIANPLTKVPKTYQVKVNALLPEEEQERLRGGLAIGRGEVTGPAALTFLRDNGRFSWFELTIQEGKNRQVRRMFEALGHTVLKLTRTRIGRLELGDLTVGQWRPIHPRDVLGR